jgi:chemotaxis protein methyltransferase CheR
VNASSIPEVDRFRLLVGRRFGLHFDDSKLNFLADVLARHSEAAGEPTSVYLNRLDVQRDRQRLRALASELTVGETYFFRNIEQFRAVSEVVVPERMAARGSLRRLRILSAGCASGEEPYSLALLLREREVDPGWEISIRAVDVNPAMLEKAAQGRYSAWALRETPEEVKKRWFKAQGREFLLDEAIKSRVAFLERNLADDDSELWAPETYDIVFCRNVVMYFTPQEAQILIGRITRALKPRGYLFLGHAETLRGVSSDFHLRHTHETFYYQRHDRLAASTDATSAPAFAESRAAVPADPLQSLMWASTWIDTVQRASERIRSLAESSRASMKTPDAVTVAMRAPPAVHLNVVLECLKQERFTDALELLGNLPGESPQDREVLLLRAVLLTHSGQLDAAERVCSELLQLDELSAGAHYLLALCREGSGDRCGAAEHDRVATYLDPGFAMPRLHLGLMARRLGDREDAQRELGQALTLLQREDPSRLLLFGGGFGHEALVALCRAELRALEVIRES